MKVLLLCNKVPFPATDGSTIAMASMIDALVNNGVNVKLLCFNTIKHPRTEAQIAESNTSQVPIRYIHLDNNVKPIPALLNLFSRKAFHVSRFMDQEFKNALVEELQSEDYDLVQLEGLSMGVYLSDIRANSNARVVLRAHNVESVIWDRHLASERKLLRKLYLGIQNSRLRKFEYSVSQNVDALVSITEQDQIQFQNIAPGKRAISIPCGVKLDHYPKCSKANKRFDLVYLASFDWLPNVQGLEWFLEEVWPEVLKARPSTTFRLGGRHMPTEILEQADSNLFIESEVDDMRSFMCSGKIAIVPLLAGSGMRIKVLENMALGICQLTTTIGAEGIEVSSDQDIIIADKAKDFAGRIIELLNNESRIEDIAQNARVVVAERYTNDFLGKKLVQFYLKEVLV